MTGLKRGKLSKAERAYIEQNCFDLQLAEMAEKLNRSVAPVRRYINDHNLKAKDKTDDEHLLSTLRTKYYYEKLQKQFDKGEILFFENHWIDFFKQFNEDVTHTEEMQIIEVIRTEVLINRSMEDRMTIMHNIESLEESIDSELEKDADKQNGELIGTWQSQLGAMIGSKSSYINEHKELLSKKEKYLKDLKGTREQRKRVSDDSKTNFTMWMRELDKLELREQEGFDMEVQAVAADAARKRLAEFHEFEDGEVDQPLLNSDTVITEGEE